MSEQTKPQATKTKSLDERWDDLQKVEQWAEAEYNALLEAAGKEFDPNKKHQSFSHFTYVQPAKTLDVELAIASLEEQGIPIPYKYSRENDTVAMTNYFVENKIPIPQYEVQTLDNKDIERALKANDLIVPKKIKGSPSLRAPKGGIKLEDNNS